jgi:hypothetical protein
MWHLCGAWRYLKVAASAGDGARGPDLAVIDNLHLHPFTTAMSLRPAICRTSLQSTECFVIVVLAARTECGYRMAF